MDGVENVRVETRMTEEVRKVYFHGATTPTGLLYHTQTHNTR
jgi:hypothetical protein